MKKISTVTFLLIAVVLTVCKTFFKQEGHNYHNPSLIPGTLLFSPVGKKEAFYIGHVGIVTRDGHVIHSVPSGILKDSLSHYLKKFSFLSMYEPVDEASGFRAAAYAEKLHKQHPEASYRVLTQLTGSHHRQYCTKLIWQSFYYGAGINTVKFLLPWLPVHPSFLKIGKHFKKLG